MSAEGEHPGTVGVKARDADSTPRMHPVVPWIIGFIVLLPLPLVVGNAYHQYVVNIIAINIKIGRAHV